MAPAIIGGVPSCDPSSVLLFLDGARAATGTRVGPQTILLAGHSVVKTEIENIRVFQWVCAKDGQPEMAELGAVEEKRVHESYVKDEDRRDHDIALIRLAKETEWVGHPYPVSLVPLKRDVPFRVAGHGATRSSGKPNVKQLSGENLAPGPLAEPLIQLKSLAWEKKGLIRFYGSFTHERADAGKDVSPDSGDSGLGLIQDGAVRAVFSGSHYDEEVDRMALAAVPLGTAENRSFLEKALDDGFQMELQTK